jgi:hypothetical protein
MGVVMRRTLIAALIGLSAAGLVGCAPTPLPPADGNGFIRLPPEAGGFVLDADRRATSHIAATLTAPSRQEGNPAAQAQALGFFEFATVALNGPRWAGLNPLAVVLLRQGRDELRAAYGIRPDAPAQVVVDSFFKAASALSVGDSVGAVRSFPPGILTVPGEQVVARLAAQPPLPRVADASAFAGRALDRLDGGGAKIRHGWLFR